MLFGQLVDDPSSWPERFPTEEAQEAERQRLFRIIEELVLWENSNNERVLNKTRAEIARSLAWARGEEPPSRPKAVNAYIAEHAPPVYDPFCGGGSILLEAQRLGLQAYGSDLNPVAVMISKALVEIPSKFAGQPPVNPEAQKELRRGGLWNGKGAQGLAEDVRYYGQWMWDEAQKRIGHLYPQVDLPEEYGGGKATVIAWLWTRTVASPNPACNGAHVPLVRSFDLSTKKNNRVWAEPIVEQANNSYRFEIRMGTGKARAGTVKRDGAICLLSGTPIPLSYIRSEAQAGRMVARLLAVVAERDRQRIYLPPTLVMEELARSAKPEDVPETNLPQKALGFRVQAYGMTRHRDLFTDRQLVALTTFSDLVGEARDKTIADARAAGWNHDEPGLEDGGTGATAYADAVATYLAFAVSKLADYNSTLVVWSPTRDQAKSTFARHALPMVWDYTEVNPFAGAAGDLRVSINGQAKVLASLPCGPAGEVQQAAAQDIAINQTWACSTDPPYYDNIGYADLSDFFYVWLRRSMKQVAPKIFGTMLVPKSAELVATPYRHGGRAAAEVFFLAGMTEVITKIAARTPEMTPVTIYYAFKQSEAHDQGNSSTGWETFLDAVLRSGFAVCGTWPIRTERGARPISIGTNALASSIVLVCRKRRENAPVTTRADFIRALKRELPAALKLLQHGSIAPVDMAQASIGPGMAIFTRHAKVLESDDSPMTVKTALQLINQALDEYLSEQEAEYDADTRFAITWFETHGMEVGPYGTAETLATARGVAVTGVAEAGILESRGGNVRLLRRDEMPDDWNPDTDTRLTVWECSQHLIRILETEGEQAAANLLSRLGERGEVARDLAYRLYGICERKKWADEALAYNSLVVVWPELIKLAASAQGGPAQAELEI